MISYFINYLKTKAKKKKNIRLFRIVTFLCVHLFSHRIICTRVEIDKCQYICYHIKRKHSLIIN